MKKLNHIKVSEKEIKLRLDRRERSGEFLKFKLGRDSVKLDADYLVNMGQRFQSDFNIRKMDECYADRDRRIRKFIDMKMEKYDKVTEELKALREANEILKQALHEAGIYVEIVK